MKTKKTFEVQTLIVSFVIIAFCEVFLLIDTAADLFQIDIAIPWIDHQDLEFISTATLTVALFAIGWEIRRLLRQHRDAEVVVQVASGELLDVIHAKFDAWSLTPSECEVALLLIKGFSAQEISDLRETRPGTVKSQSSAIYQKAGVAGRNELVAYFVEDLLAGETVTPKSQ